MLGRGVIADPGLMQRLKSLEHAQKTGEDSDRKENGMEQSGSEIYRTGKQELRAFHDTIFRQYREIFDEDKNAIFHMKELWSYLVPVSYTHLDVYKRQDRISRGVYC